MRSASRLPRRLRRPVSRGTRSFVQNRHRRHKEWRRERWRRTARRAQHSASQIIGVFRRWFLFIALMACLAAFGLLLFSPLVEVRQIHIQRSQARLDLEHVQKILAPLFGRHLLFLSSHEILALLRPEIPDLQDMSIRKQYPSDLSVRITLRPIVAALTIEEPVGSAPASSPTIAKGSGSVTTLPDSAYDYLTDNGIYVVSPVAVSGAALPTFRIVDWAVRPVPGTSLIGPELMNRMQDAEKILVADFSAQIRSRTVFLRAREFHINTGKIALWFDTRSPLPEQLTRYRTFLKTVPAGEAKQYVDLRLAGKIVYR